MSKDGNKKLGISFERSLCELLAANGFWTHNFAQKKDGQPADIIAVRNRIAYLIDCKVCKKEFVLDRIEGNQELSMIRWNETGNNLGYFAIFINNEIYMLDHQTAFQMRQSRHALSVSLISKVGIKFEDWIEKCE